MMMENIKQILGENGRTISNEDRGLASMMMDNEPRMQDRSAEGQMFSLESEIKNLMKEYEIAVRDGDNERAQRIADIINELDAQKIGISGGMADKMLSNQLNSRGSSNLDRQILSQQMTGKDFFAKGDEVKKSGPLGLGIIEAIRGGVGSAFTDPMSAQNYAMNAIKGRMKQDEPTIREMFEKAFKQARMEGKEVFEFMGKMYHTKTAEEVQGMAEGGEATQEITSPVVRIDVDFKKYFTPGGALDEQAYNQALEEAKTKSKNIQEVLLNYEKAIQVANPEEKQMLIKDLQEFIDTEKKYNNFSEIFTPSLAVKMAEGGEAQMQMSEQEAMAELEAAGPDFEIVEQLIGAVVQMIQQGVSEAEVKEFLREQGLDEEDIQELFEMVMERLQQASVEEPIGRELQGMM